MPAEALPLLGGDELRELRGVDRRPVVARLDTADLLAADRLDRARDGLQERRRRRAGRCRRTSRTGSAGRRSALRELLGVALDPRLPGAAAASRSAGSGCRRCRRPGSPRASSPSGLPRSPVTVPPRLEPRLLKSSANDERSNVSCARFAGVSKPPSALNDSFSSATGIVISSVSANRAESAAELFCATWVRLDSSGTATAEPPQPAAATATSTARAAGRAWRRRTVMLRVCIDGERGPLIHQTGYRRSAAPPPRRAASRPPARRSPARVGRASRAGRARRVAPGSGRRRRRGRSGRGGRG